MAGLKRSLKCDDLLTMTISQQQQQQSGMESSSCRSSSSSSSSSCSSTGLDSLMNEQQSLVLISQFVQLRTTGASGSSPSKRQRFATTTKNPATAALECLEASWDYRSFQTAVAMLSN